MVFDVAFERHLARSAPQQAINEEAMTENTRDLYRRANDYRRTPFVDRPYFGSPGAPAQAATNASQIWAHLNAGYLTAYEYTHWQEESLALRSAAIIGDWSWLNKVRITGPDAEDFLDWASAKSVTRQQIGQALFSPLLSENGNIAVEGILLKLDENDYLYTQSGAQYWLKLLAEKSSYRVELEDVTPDWTCFAVQGPKSREVLEEVLGASLEGMGFSRIIRLDYRGDELIVQRQGVTGELGYELLLNTAGGNGHHLWAAVRDTGRAVGLRELGFKAQMIGHTESNIPTVIRDYLPDRFGDTERLTKFARLWASAEDFAAIDYPLTDQLATPDALGWGKIVTIDHDFHGREGLLRERESGGPARRLRGLVWNADDVAQLFADQLRDVDAPPAPDLPWWQFRLRFLDVRGGGDRIGYASSVTYSPTLRSMISLSRLDADIPEGTEVQVRWKPSHLPQSRLIRARVVPLPFIPYRRHL